MPLQHWHLLYKMDNLLYPPSLMWLQKKMLIFPHLVFQPNQFSLDSRLVVSLCKGYSSSVEAGSCFFSETWIFISVLIKASLMSNSGRSISPSPLMSTALINLERSQGGRLAMLDFFNAFCNSKPSIEPESSKSIDWKNSKMDIPSSARY